MTDLIPTRVHNLIIVDESGSMECIRKQAFTGMNETLQTVRMMQKKYPNQLQYVTLITFSLVIIFSAWLISKVTLLLLIKRLFFNFVF